MLACKARGREVLGRGRAPHRDGNVGSILPFELSIGFGDLLSKVIGTGGIEDDRPRFGGAGGQHINAGLVDGVEKLMQSVPGSGTVECGAVGLGR